MWKWQHLCKTGRCVCEIDCSVFSDTKSLRKARQAPLGQIRPSGRNRSLCRAHKSLSQEWESGYPADLWLPQKIQNWVISCTSLMSGTGLLLCCRVRTKEEEEWRKNWSSEWSLAATVSLVFVGEEIHLSCCWLLVSLRAYTTVMSWKKTPGVTINKVFSMNQLFENDEQL